VVQTIVFIITAFYFTDILLFNCGLSLGSERKCVTLCYVILCCIVYQVSINNTNVKL